MDDIERTTPKKWVNHNVALAPGDLTLLEWTAAFLGCSKAEVMRSAIRSFASQLSMIDRNQAK